MPSCSLCVWKWFLIGYAVVSGLKMKLTSSLFHNYILLSFLQESIRLTFLLLIIRKPLTVTAFSKLSSYNKVFYHLVETCFSCQSLCCFLLIQGPFSLLLLLSLSLHWLSTPYQNQPQLHLIYISQPTAPEASPQLYIVNTN